MSIESTLARPAASTPAERCLQAAGLEHCIVRRGDGIYADPSVPRATFQAAVDSIFSSSNYFSGIDYAVLLKALYDCGPDLPQAKRGDMMRIASDIVAFAPLRRDLYKAVKIGDGKAEYYFEPVYMADPDDPGGPGVATALDADEFVADMWTKGIRFGIDMDAVRRAIAAGKTERVVVARQLDAAPGVDAHIIEVNDGLHRSDAPRQLANGKLDLMTFENRFPQIRQGARLLKKVARSAGSNGFELSGRLIEPPVPKDVDLGAIAGPGTTVEITAEGEFLVALQAGFLHVDRATSKLSVGDKIVSRDGVSVRTTGNLQLTGDYEEFGEVQEKRVIEGEGITVHADVFGNIVSRGGTILLNRNLVGGSAHNAHGDITVKGVSSSAVIRAADGQVVLGHAQSCVISGSRIVVEHATNCEIIGDDVTIGQAEGCAVAGRRVEIGSAGPRKQSEMLVFVLQPDCTQMDDAIARIGERIGKFAALAAARKAEMEALTSQPEVRQYMMLANRVRKKEISLTADQAAQFQKMAMKMGPALKTIGRLSDEIKVAESEQQTGATLLEQMQREREASVGVNSVKVGMLNGDTLIRTINYHPDGGKTYDLAPKEIRAMLRGPGVPKGASIFAGSVGSVEWNSSAHA